MRGSGQLDYMTGEILGPSKQAQPQNVVKRFPIGALKQGLVVASEP